MGWYRYTSYSENHYAECENPLYGFPFTTIFRYNVVMYLNLGANNELGESPLVTV